MPPNKGDCLERILLQSLGDRHIDAPALIAVLFDLASCDESAEFALNRLF